MKTYLRGVALGAALMLTLAACGGGGDTKSAAQRLGGGESATAATTPAGGGTEASAPAATDAASAAAATPAATAAATGRPAAPEPPPPSPGHRADRSRVAAAPPAAWPTRPRRPARPRPPAPPPVRPGAGVELGRRVGGRIAGTRPSPRPGGAAPGGADKIGLTQTEILFGIHLPQSGPVGVLLGNAWKGADPYFRSINDAGGINGRKVRLVVADDKYSAQGAASAVRDLIDNKKVFAVGCPVGVDQCSVSSDYANSKGVPDQTMAAIDPIDTGISQPVSYTKPAGFSGRTRPSPSGRSTPPRPTRSAASTSKGPVKVFLQFTVSGIAAGSLYAIVALGVVLLYRGTRVVNFAHAGFGESRRPR